MRSRNSLPPSLSPSLPPSFPPSLSPSLPPSPSPPLCASAGIPSLLCACSRQPTVWWSFLRSSRGQVCPHCIRIWDHIHLQETTDKQLIDTCQTHTQVDGTPVMANRPLVSGKLHHNACFVVIFCQSICYKVGPYCTKHTCTKHTFTYIHNNIKLGVAMAIVVGVICT